jgi:peptide deformylase
MSKVKNIITDTKQLSDWSIEVDTRKDGKLLQEIVLALKETMRANNLYSLSAPQIGYNKRVFCIRFGDKDYRTFVNPAVENNIGITMSRETCSSIPGKTYIIPRFNKIKFFYTTPLGKVESATLAGRAAYVFQHALDHLNGMLIEDIGLEIDEMFDNATDEEREEVLRMYAESLDLRMKDLQEEIKNDSELSQIDDAIKFMRSVGDKETTLKKSPILEETKK